jgi:hypothetical protein
METGKHDMDKDKGMYVEMKEDMDKEILTWKYTWKWTWKHGHGNMQIEIWTCLFKNNLFQLPTTTPLPPSQTRWRCANN